jgi:hypothetical protein
MDAVQEYELLHSNTEIATHATVDNVSSEAPSVEPPHDKPHILTIAELQVLIESGRKDQIPNNKFNPEALNVRVLYVFCSTCYS